MGITDEIIKRKRAHEQLLAAAALVNPEGVYHDTGWLQIEKITDETVRTFWREYLVDGNAIQAAIKTGTLDKIYQWSVTMPSSLHGKEYADRIIQENDLLTVAIETPKIAMLAGEGKYEDVRAAISALNDSKPILGNKTPDAADIGIEFIEMLTHPEKPILTGIDGMDRCFGGLWRAIEFIICARPSAGKTALGLQIARNVTKRNKVIFFSLEMKATLLWARMACGLCEINIRDMMADNLALDDKQRLLDATSTLMGMYSGKFLIDDSTSTTTEHIWNVVAREKPDVIVVDHLSLIKDIADNEVKRLGLITQRIKAIAKEFNLCAIVLSQLNRALEARAEKMPMLYDLRDSGEIEQNADIVLGIEKSEEMSSHPSRIIPVNFGVLKFRDGMAGAKIETRFDRLAQWFESVNRLP